MTRNHDSYGIVNSGRRGPVAHAEALQEAKRLEKMQTVCSSHRTAGTARLPATPTKDAAPR